VAGSSSPNNPKFYDPSPAIVSQGTTVTWTNHDSAVHTVTAGTPDSPQKSVFDSGFMSPNKTFSHKFDSAGTFDYFCELHPYMTGQVQVQ
jgi:plastocyanin